MAPSAQETVLTAEGKAQLEDELHELETTKRDEVGERIRIAREFGDISENSEYDDAKNEQAFIERRISEINDILANAQVVDAPKGGSKVVIGSTITLVDDRGTERTFTIVGGAEADSAEGRISNESPLGAAALGHKKGDKIAYVGPTGREMSFTLTKVGH